MLGEKIKQKSRIYGELNKCDGYRRPGLDRQPRHLCLAAQHLSSYLSLIYPVDHLRLHKDHPAMYGRESPLPWSTPPRRRTAAAAGAPTNDDPEPSSTRRFSTGFTYAGMDGSGSTSSGGFTNVTSGGALGGHTRSGSHGGYSSLAPGGAGGGGVSAERTNREKVNQIVQAYFGKAAMIILHTRVALPPVYSPKTGTKKVNKWVWSNSHVLLYHQAIRNSDVC